VGEVLFVDADRNGRRLRGHLKDGVGDLAVEPPVLSGGDHIKTVTEFVKCGFVHRRFSLQLDLSAI
jgi:hypothetical protein